ncbi:MAG TPA: KH domain-containing protein [Candidatus Bilamarchaeum sp.]|nr:KH domain-containing protein [Candidatus Bilamarchaeum sp.]
MDKRIVLPGEKIASGRMNIPNTYSDGDSTFAAVVGMMDADNRYIALENRYKPVVGEVVVGVVTDVRHAGYEVDLNLPEGGFIPTRDIRLTLQLGDFVICKVKSVNEVGDVDLGEVRRLPRGKIVEFPSAKVPRLIGRKSSMLNLLRDYAGGDIMVGNNGFVWISEKCDMPLLLEAIGIIDKKAHKSGLTDEISSFLRSRKGDIVREERPEETEGENYGEQRE